MQNKTSFFGGLLLTIFLSVLSSVVSSLLPLGAVSLAIISGILLGNFFPVFTEKNAEGIRFSEKKILEIAVALTGVNLNFRILYALGEKVLFLVVSTLLFGLFAAYFLSRYFSISRRFGLLLGIGNGICGSSAIAATEKILGASQEETGISIAVVNFLGTLGLFLLPVFSLKFIGFSEIKTGIWIGNSLQAVGQVAASGFSVSESAGEIAVLVKMARILMLFPVVLVLLFFFKNNSEAIQGKIKFPYFILGFVFFSLLPSLGILSEDTLKLLGKVAHYLLVVAMAGIGLKIKFSGLLRTGKKALLFGSFLFLIQMLFTGIVLGTWN